jgi:hypothetical protein
VSVEAHATQLDDHSLTTSEEELMAFQFKKHHFISGPVFTQTLKGCRIQDAHTE